MRTLLEVHPPSGREDEAETRHSESEEEVEEELAGLPWLRQERDRLVEHANGLGLPTPALLTRPTPPNLVPDTEWKFNSEHVEPEEIERLKKQKKQVFFHRTMNSFAVMQKRQGALVPVIPEFHRQDDKNDQNTYFLIGFASPLTDGARRAARALAGYTPLYKRWSHPQLWQMQTKPLQARVKTPYMGKLYFYGCEIPCVMFPSADRDDVEYGVQTPDPIYKPFWQATMATWAVEHALGNSQLLQPWKDVDLAGPRPWFMPVWTMRILRYEYGLPPESPDDPPRRAMLGGCRTNNKGRRAPKTEAEWLAIPAEQSALGDDEAGLSDAGSINDDVELGLPTSSHWDPVTKMSTTPRGNEPHPYPEQVALELERNRAYAARVALESHAGPSRSQPANPSHDHLTSPPLPSPPPQLQDHTNSTDVEMTPVVPSIGASSSSTSPVTRHAPPPTSPSGHSNSRSARRPVRGTGPPRMFAPPLPGTPTIRSGLRNGSARTLRGGRQDCARPRGSQ